MLALTAALGAAPVAGRGATPRQGAEVTVQSGDIVRTLEGR